MCPFDFGKEAAETDAELQGDMDKLTALSADMLLSMLPKREDQKALKALIDAVAKESAVNRKKAVFFDRLGTVSESVKDCALKIIDAAT